MRLRLVKVSSNIGWLRVPSWKLLHPEKLKHEEQKVIEPLCRLSPEVMQGQVLAWDFVKLIRERRFFISGARDRLKAKCIG